MEVIIPSPGMDFNFDSACTSPYVSAPSSPQRFGNFFFSAPTSPTRASSFYREFNNYSLGGGGGETTTALGDSSLTIPFDWEEKPGIRKVKASRDVNNDTDFEFDFSGQLERISLSADELFDGGKIKPLKPPPRLQSAEFNDSPISPRSPKSPRSPIRSKILSPRQRKRDFDPFAAAIEETRKQSSDPQQRGREKTHSSSNSSTRHKATRSCSPFRVSDILMEREINHEQSTNSSEIADNKNSSSSSSSSSFSNLSSALSWRNYRKWKLKDFLLFRSASEGRATNKDTLKKYSMLKKSSGEDVKNSSFRSMESAGSVSSRRRGPVSAHEFHYTVNRAVTEEMKRKTFLPYNKGLLGCLGFNPAVHGISGRVGSMPRV